MKKYVFCLSFLLVCLIAFTGCSQEEIPGVPAAPAPSDDATLLASQMEMIRTRGVADGITTIIVTTKKEMEFTIGQQKTVIVDWGDGEKQVVTQDPGTERTTLSHSYTDALSVHTIYFYGEADALVRLYLRGQEVIYLDVARNTALFELSCWNNRLTQIDVSKNLGLNTLSIIESKINSIDVTNNINLSSVYIVKTPLDSLDISKNVNMLNLNCSECGLKSLDVTHNLKLTALQCQKNNLISIDLSNNTELGSFLCFTNHLKSLNLKNNGKLRMVWCFMNDFCKDPVEVINTVSALPDRRGIETGDLMIGASDMTVVNAICAAKNWQAL